jgi:hypothetical protein
MVTLGTIAGTGFALRGTENGPKYAESLHSKTHTFCRSACEDVGAVGRRFSFLTACPPSSGPGLYTTLRPSPFFTPRGLFGASGVPLPLTWLWMTAYSPKLVEVGLSEVRFAPVGLP